MLNPKEVKSLLEADKAKADAKEIHARDRPKVKFHGLTQNEYDKLKSEQKGRCFLCGRSAKLELDHCHKTKRARKFLCRYCNQRLGYFETWLDNVSLQDVLNYID